MMYSTNFLKVFEVPKKKLTTPHKFKYVKSFVELAKVLDIGT